MSVNSNVFTNQNLFTLQSYIRTIYEPGHTLLQLEANKTFTVTGKDSDFENPAVNFYINRTTTNGTDDSEIVLQFRPKEYPDKYITLSGEDVILQGADEITDLSHCFVVLNPNDDYYVFKSLSSESPQYLTARTSGLLSVTENHDFASWFHILIASENIGKEEESILGTWNIEKISTVIVVEE